MRDIQKRFNKITEIFASKEFMQNKTQGGELGFYIFDYDPEDELIVRDFTKNLLNNYDFSGSEIKLIELDLYKLIIEILEAEKAGNKSILDLTLDMEAKDGTARLEKGLKAVVTPAKFIKLIENKLQDHNIIFITGVGKAWPLVRSHTILNNLQPVLDKIPVIIFYPGAYDQKDLRLFKGRTFSGTKDDNYYRAFKLVEDNL